MKRVRATLASGNEHKLRELRALLPEWDIEPLESREMPGEKGSTFYENALGKARFARTVGPRDRWVLGEDSGLEVEGLGGAPGIRSARYAGSGTSDEANLAKLLAELAGAEGAARKARYVSELVCISPADVEFQGTGTLEGTVADQPRGSEGFGYDPVFVPEGEQQTVAELGDEWKSTHSHRARAARALLVAVGGSGAAL
jgi:XTP/dITP diphosphohydrolase